MVLDHFQSFLSAEVVDEANSNVGKVAQTSLDAFKGIVNTIFPIFIGVILVIALFYGVQLGIKYAKAEEEEEKKKAKGSLINVIVGCLIAIVFVVIIEVILSSNLVDNLFGDVAKSPSGSASSSAGS